ncbi:hypothetical protein N0V94_002531 [Neodidymelliopsis sp. IMI 364377]|nr:hypothetical protein N0V94_002531 [Neodidymelliopsis sp. IMI 364377]
MDPGLGLIVNSIVPTKCEEPTSPTKAPLQLPDGFLEKPHVRHALKYMPDDEQRERVLEVALAWKQKFRAEQWKPVIAAIETASREDTVRSSPLTTDLHDFQQKHSLVVRPRAMTAASAPTIPLASSHTMTPRASITRHTTTIGSLPSRRRPPPITPQPYRWDVIQAGPVTPLSSEPRFNSFSGEGFWVQPTSPVEPPFRTSTPITILEDDKQNASDEDEQGSPDDDEQDCLDEDGLDSLNADGQSFFDEYEQESPSEDSQNSFNEDEQDPSEEDEQHSLVMSTDLVAVQIIEKIQDEIGSLARKYCFARHRIRLSPDEDSYIPDAYIRPEDMMTAARVALKYRQVKLKTAVIKDLPDRLRSFAVEETIMREQLCIKDEAEIFEQNDWMNNEAFTKMQPFTTVLEDADGKECELGSTDHDTPTSLAVTILDEQRKALRMLRKQRIGSDLDLTVEMLHAAWATRIMEDVEQLVEYEDDTSDGSDEYDDGYDYGNVLRSIKEETIARSRGLSSLAEALSNSDVAADLASIEARLNALQSVSWRRCEEPQSSERSSASFFVEQRPSIETIEEVPNADLSPVDRDFRHRGPDLADLDGWAEELKKMEAMRIERQRLSARRHHRPTHTQDLSSLTPTPSETKRMSIDTINGRMSPSRQLHSRFSSTSSMSTTTLMSHPRLQMAHHSTNSSLSRSENNSGSTVLDHQCHQRRTSKTSANKHYRDASRVSVHSSLRRHQHLRSTSSVNVLVKSSTREEEDEWLNELKRMESRERLRQSKE